jgi:hypothetical protein
MMIYKSKKINKICLVFKMIIFIKVIHFQKTQKRNNKERILHSKIKIEMISI